MGARPAVRRRARARVARADADRKAARHPERDYLRLRDRLAAAPALPRAAEQSERGRRLRLPPLQVPDHAVDGQSLVAAADLFVSAGGTMNREAVALAVPVYTTFGGKLGGVDEMLIREGRLILLSD